MPSLIIVRGNSGSGKSSVAEGLRAEYGPGVAWIEQGHVRRTIFAELDQPDGANITAIEQLAVLALSRDFTTIVEGILPTARYGEMRTWYHEHDLLGHPGERVIDQTSSLRQTIGTVAGIAGLQRVC